MSFENQVLQKEKRGMEKCLGSRDEVAIRVRCLSKCYHLYDKPQDRFKQAIFAPIQRLLGIRVKTYAREFWALKDISFEVKKGETVGIIGRNGSGKSTLLQIIAGTLNATHGEVQVNGRVAALLELGSGFNPEFTGRENVYVNAAIHGLSRSETDARFDEIAAFADIGGFLEQPIKTYSSGMLMRLAFAVSACMEPDILVVDEALGIGDAPFQSKSYKRIRRLVDDGKSVLFVSHDIATVRSICSSVLWLKNGIAEMEGDTKEVVRCYEKYCWMSSGVQVSNDSAGISADGSEVAINATFSPLDTRDYLSSTSYGTRDVEVLSISVLNREGQPIAECDYNEELTIRLQIVANATVSTEYLIGVRFRNVKGDWVFAANNFNQIRRLTLDKGEKSELRLQLSVPLTHDNYTILVGLIAPQSGKIYTNGAYQFANCKIWHVVEEAAHLRVKECKYMPLNGPVHFPLRFID